MIPQKELRRNALLQNSTLIYISPWNCRNGYTGILGVLSIVIGLLLVNALAAGQILVILLGILIASGGIVAIV